MANFDTGHLETNVSRPQRENEGAKDSYISYLVTTKTDFKSFMKPETSVRRRFTDFVFLYNTLFKEYPAVAVPPLPDKHNMSYVRGDRFSGDFTMRRANSLRRFLKRITLHPELRRSSILLQFLESPEWHATMKARPQRGLSHSSASDGGGGIIDTLTDTFINTFTKVHKPDKRFIEVKERADKLDEDLSHVEKKIASVAYKQSQLETDYSDLTAQFQKLQALEPGVEQELTQFARSLEEEANSMKGLREFTDLDYLASLRDMSAYISAQKSLLKAREQKQLDFEELSNYLAKAAAERDSLASERGTSTSASGFLTRKIEDVRGIDHEQARRDKIRKLELQIERLTREVEQARVGSEMFDDRTVAEVGEFERIKATELKDTLGGLADAHMQFFGRTIETWERFLRDMGEDDGAQRSGE